MRLSEWRKGEEQMLSECKSLLCNLKGCDIEKLLVGLFSHKAVFISPIMLPYNVTVRTRDDGKFSVTDAKRCKYFLYFVHSDEKL